jgi:transcriptional regulator with XRE-family HTH domain
MHIVIDMDIKQTLIDCVREAITTKGLTQAEIARAADVSASGLWRILEGKQAASIALWQRIFDACELGESNPTVAQPDSKPIENSKSLPDKPIEPKRIQNRQPTVRADLTRPLVPPKSPASVYGEPRVISADEFDRL